MGGCRLRHLVMRFGLDRVDEIREFHRVLDKENGNIKIDCYELSSFYQFTVSDDGPGIEQKYFEKIFMIFQTLKEKDAFESTGVGLAIVKKILDEIKGTISVTSEPGTGSSFTFTWPKKL